MATTLTPEGAVLAVVMMRRPGNRGRLLLLIAGAPADEDGFHELGVRAAAHYLGTGTGHVHNLLRQLVAGSVIERRAGAGRRADGWRFRAAVERWDVGWSRDADHVRLTLLEAGHIVDIPDEKPLLAFTSMGERKRFFARAFMGERSRGVAFTHGGERKTRRLRSPLEVNATPSSSSTDDGPPGIEPRRREDEVSFSPFVVELRALVLRRTGRPAYGKGLDRLVALDGRLSLDAADRALSSLPADAGFGLIVEALRAAAGPATNGHRAPPAPAVWQPEPFDAPDVEGKQRVRALLGAVRARQPIPESDEP